MKLIGAVGLAATLLVAGCGSDDITAPATTTPTSPTTVTFTSIVSPLGTVTRTFTATQTGTISVTLTAAGPAVVVGLGLGIPVSGTCGLTTAVNTGPGSAAQITTAADAGDYCVAILDIGNAPKTGINFVISIVHP